MPVSFQPDPVRRWVVVTVPPATRWARFQQAVLATVEASPELTDWNWIIDDQQPMDDVDAAGMAEIGAAFRRLGGERGRSAHTVVVTTDRHFDSWARVIDLNYGGRRHHSAPTLAAAAALMERLEAARPQP